MPTPSWLLRGIDGWRLRPAGQCSVCRSWNREPICAPCVDRFAPAVARCGGCGLRLPMAAARCGACALRPPAFDACVVGCDYVFPWDRLIADFKFNAQVELAAPLAQRLVQVIRSLGTELPDLLLPVPLAPRRLAERGYNQAWELTRQLARRLGCAADAHGLARPVDGAHQAQLTLPQRLANLRGAFMVEPARRQRLHGLHVALVDDVMTSGATLREAAGTLRRAGAARVDAWVLARTPAPVPNQPTH